MYKGTMTFTKGQMWKDAIKSEIDSILQNYTWELVDLSLGCKPFECKWVYRRKIKLDGFIEKYKAILVVKCYKHCEGHNYFDNFSLSTKINSIRMILSIASLWNLKNTSNGCEKNFLKWVVRWRNLYRTTWRFYCSRLRKESINWLIQYMIWNKYLNNGIKILTIQWWPI